VRRPPIFIYTLLGSVTTAAFVAIYLAGTFDSFNCGKDATGIGRSLRSKGGWLGTSPEPRAGDLRRDISGFCGEGAAHPFHTWLPNAYAEAPTGVSMVLTGVMSKWAFMVYPHPDAALSGPDALAVDSAALVGGGHGRSLVLCGICQRDLKR